MGIGQDKTIVKIVLLLSGSLQSVEDDINHWIK